MDEDVLESLENQEGSIKEQNKNILAQMLKRNAQLKQSIQKLSKQNIDNMAMLETIKEEKENNTKLEHS